MERKLMLRYIGGWNDVLTVGKLYEFWVDVHQQITAIIADDGELFEVFPDTDFRPEMAVKCPCVNCDGGNDLGFSSIHRCWVCDGEGFQWKSEIAWVNLYRVTRCYGGPEEGGWWFDAYECVGAFPTQRHLAADLKAEFIISTERLGWGDISSVLGGEEYVVYIEDEKAESETRERPVYC